MIIIIKNIVFIIIIKLVIITNDTDDVGMLKFLLE